jgi:predicted nucleic acid-binding protein
MYVARAEAPGASLVTTDARLAGAAGPRCPLEVLTG